MLVLLHIFVNPTMSINNGSVGLVGYNVRLTKRQAIRGRSPVRFWYGILFLPKAVPGTARGCLLYTSPSPRDVEESRMPSSA